MGKGLRSMVESKKPEVLCLQETKAEKEQVDTDWIEELGYHQLWNSAEKRGYSGTAVWSLRPFKESSLGIGVDEHDKEGRVITASFDDFHLVNVYTPNAKRGLLRLPYRLTWDAAFLSYVNKLRKTKPVIFCGDLNCAHREIDLKNPKANKKNAGFSPEERKGVDAILEAGFVDVFREQHPEPDHYTWWTYRNNARARNIGWRIDYFFVDRSLWDAGKVRDANILSDVFGSDHCPVELTLQV